MTPDQQALTKQDLREALDAALQTITARQDATDARLDAAVKTLIARQEATIEAFAHNLSDLRRELMEQFERLQNRTERTEINVSALLMQTAGMSRSLSVLERSDGQTAATQNAQQRAIDDLYAQIAELKRRLLPPQ